MFGLDLLSTAMLGVAASFVAGLLTLVPALGASDARKAWTAVAVLVAFVLGKDGFTFVDWPTFFSSFAAAAVYAVVSYKLVFQPIILPMVSTGLASAGITGKTKSKR